MAASGATDGEASRPRYAVDDVLSHFCLMLHFVGVHFYMGAVHLLCAIWHWARYSCYDDTKAGYIGMGVDPKYYWHA